MKNLSPKYLVSTRGFSSLILVVAITVILLTVGFLFYKKLIPIPEINKQPVLTTSNEDISEKNSSQKQITFLPITETEFQSIPVAIEDKLALIPLPQYGKEPIITQILNAGGYSGAADFGSGEPQPAPNLKRIAFIEKGVLGFISAEGKQVTKLPKELKVEYISGWSSDSKKLIIYVAKSSLEDMFMGYGNEGPGKTKYDLNKYPGGFYLLDVDKGSVNFIEPLGKFVSWIGNDQILSVVSFPQDNQDSEENYIVFNLNSSEADPEILKGKFDDYFSKQFSFSEDGKKWAFSIGNTGNSQGTNYSNVIVANFPDTNGITVAEGSWADFQGPIISPDGLKVIYVYHGGGSAWETMLWDGKDKKHLVSGRPYMWIDNNQFLMTQLEYNPQTSKSTNKIFLYDIPSSAEQQLY